MSVLDLWRVIANTIILKVVRDYDHEILYAGSAGDLPARLLRMRVCYVDVSDRGTLYVSVEDMKGEDHA